MTTAAPRLIENGCPATGSPPRLSENAPAQRPIRRLANSTSGGPAAPWYLAYDGAAPDRPLELHPQDGPLAATDFLPADGYFMDNIDDPGTHK